MGLIFIFFLVCALSFVVVAVMLRPTQDQKVLARRINVIGQQRTEGAAGGAEMEQYLKAQTSGSFGWIEDIFKETSFTRNLRLLILQSNSKTTLGALIVKSFVAAAAGFLLGLFFSGMWIVGLLVALVLGFIPLMILRMKKNRRVNSFNNVLADSIDMMSRSLRAGHSLPAAMGIVAEQASEPARSEFAEVSRQQNYGLPLRDAMNQLLDRIPSQDLRVVATGILVQKDTGGNLAEVLDRTGAVIRDRVRIQGEIRTHTAQGRMTGWILCLLPVIMLLLINFINPGYSTPLFKDPRGRMMLYAGLGLLSVGALIIRQIIRGIEI